MSAIELMPEPGPSGRPPLDELVRKSIKRTHGMFALSGSGVAGDDGAFERSTRAKMNAKLSSEYRDTQTLPAAVAAHYGQAPGPARPGNLGSAANGPAAPSRKLIQGPGAENGAPTSQALTLSSAPGAAPHAAHAQPSLLSQSLIRRKEARSVKPDYHPQWKLARVISGHLGWVRAVAVEPGNQWFATGAGDRVIKIWDLASGQLKLSLTGHISTVRGLAVSPRHPYLFSCGEDKMVKCWDLEQNKVIRQYHGHLSGVYAIDIHPTLDVLVTAGRDASARVWDMRTKANVHVLTGHTQTVASVKCQESEPQVITGSMDSTIRLWDLAAGKTISQLTHHHKSVRSLAIHPTEYSFASASSGGNNIKKWKCPEGIFVNNFSGHDAIINTISVNEDGALFSGGDNGSMTFWDWKTGLPFQTMQDTPQPGSLDAESGIFCSAYDVTGTRLILGCADKTVRVLRTVG